MSVAARQTARSSTSLQVHWSIAGIPIERLILQSVARPLGRTRTAMNTAPPRGPYRATPPGYSRFVWPRRRAGLVAIPPLPPPPVPLPDPPLPVRCQYLLPPYL